MESNAIYSVVVPVYNGEHTVSPLFCRVKAVFDSMGQSFEVIFVDDCGPDESWSAISILVRQYPRQARGIKLSRNFGQHRAITAGLDAACGQWIVVMDCDLQDVPEEIPRLCSRARSGYDVVLARRVARSDSFLKRACSTAFYSLLSYLTDTPQDGAIANYGLYHRRVIDAVLSMREEIRYFPVMVRWVGFSSTTLDVRHSARAEGVSGYNLRKALRLAIDVILAFSDKPLRGVVKAGVVISMFSLLTACALVVRALLGSYTVAGWASLIVSMWFLAGVTMFVLGVVGLYVGKAFEQVKERPIYIVDKIAEVEEHGSPETHTFSVRDEQKGANGAPAIN